MFTEEGTFNTDAFCKKTDDILKEQSHLVIILNTPAHNPTGYALSDEEWRRITEYLSGLSGGKTVALLIDAAYIDFAGDEVPTLIRLEPSKIAASKSWLIPMDR